ncbi:MAG TPA: hypothetical protein PK819_10570 [Thermomicrobiales bacterium]|nr:hypothetical protein [Thermomicrobiales bacterium]
MAPGENPAGVSYQNGGANAATVNPESIHAARKPVEQGLRLGNTV